MSEAGNNKPFPVTWDELHRHAKALAWRLLEMGEWRGIIAVTRGGMVPAAIIARELEVRLIDTACVASYAHQARGNAELLKPVNADVGDGAGWLVIDDLVDTGKTFELLRPLLPKAHFATIYAKPQGKPMVDTFMIEVSQDTWIYFPWDIELQFAQPLAAARQTKTTSSS